MARHMFVTVLVVFVVYASLLFVIGHPFTVYADDKVATSDAPTITETAVEVSPKVSAEAASSAESTAIQVVGHTADIDLLNAEAEIEALWGKLLSDTKLLNNVNWQSGDVVAYSYYRDIDPQFTSAKVTLGFSSDQLLLQSDVAPVNLPEGIGKAFSLDMTTGRVEEAAWPLAAVHNNLVERYWLDANGDIKRADAIVVEK